MFLFFQIDNVRNHGVYVPWASKRMGRQVKVGTETQGSK